MSNRIAVFESLQQVESLKEVIANPKKYGAPTFEEFVSNREKWIGRDDDELISADKGSQEIFKKFIRKQIYKIKRYRSEKLEEVERIALSEGLQLKDLEYRVQMLPVGGGKWDALIEFKTKAEWKRKDNSHQFKD